MQDHSGVSFLYDWYECDASWTNLVILTFLESTKIALNIRIKNVFAV